MQIQTRTYNELWGLYFDLERNCRYYEEIHARSTRWFLWLRIGTLSLLTVGAVSLLSLLPFLPDIVVAIITGLLAIGLAALTVVDFALNLQRKAAIALSIKVSLAHLRVEVEHLWRQVNDFNELTEEELKPRLRDLTLHWQELEGMAKAHDILTDHKLNRKTSDDAYKILSTRYSLETSGTPKNDPA